MMNNTEFLNSTVVIENVTVPDDEKSVYAMSEMFERDARRYNRAFLEEEEVAVR